MGQHTRRGACFILRQIFLAEREYFAAEEDEDLLVKQLRFYTRFVTVCLLLGKRDEVWDHLDKLKELVEEFRQEAQVGFKVSSYKAEQLLNPTSITNIPRLYVCSSKVAGKAGRRLSRSQREAGFQMQKIPSQASNEAYQL